jgi:hypothetical protein
MDALRGECNLNYGRLMGAGMRAPLHSTAGLLLLGFLAGTAACGANAEPDEVSPDSELVADRETPVLLTINNAHWLDVIIFVYHDGELSRVGTVTAAAGSEFTLPSWMLGQSRTIRLLADPVGSDDWIRSETINVQPGQSVEWRLESQLARSSVMVY